MASKWNFRSVFAALFAAVVCFTCNAGSAKAATINVPADQPTIQDAVNAANPLGGDTIIVAPGSYPENVVIDRSLTLLGAQANVPPVTGGRGGVGESIITGFVAGTTIGIRIQYDDVIVNGFEIAEQNFSIVTNDQGAGPTPNNYDNIDISYNYIHSTVAANAGVVLGFNVPGTSSVGGPSTFTDYSVTHNIIEVSGAGASAALGIGGGSSTYFGLDISNNDISNSNSFGIGALDPTTVLSGAIIAGNSFHDTPFGMNIGSGGDVSIRDNSFDDMGFTGFMVGIIGGEVLRNTFTDVTGTGFGVGEAFSLWGGQFGTQVSSDVDIANNFINFNGEAGQPVHGIRLRVPLGDVTTPGLGIDGTTIHIHDNTFINGGANPGALAIRHFGDPLKPADASANWWSTTSEAAILALMSGPVDFTPFLDVGTDTDVAAGFQGDFSTLNVTALGNQTGAIGRIQEGVNLVTASTVNVGPGTFDEQVVIGMSMTLNGSGPGVTVVRPSSAAILTSVYTTGVQGGAFFNSQPLAAIVQVSGVGTAGVTIRDLTVDGVNVGALPGSQQGVGILYGETGGLIDNVDVMNMNTVPLATRSFGMWHDAVAGTNVSVEVKDSSISLYNRNGINARGNNMSLNFHDNAITGPGTINATQVPNGVLMIAGATGSVTKNTIQANHHTGTVSLSGGVLLFSAGSGINIEGNEVFDVDDAVILNATDSTTVTKNNFHNNVKGVQIEAGADSNSVTHNFITDNTHGIYFSSTGGVSNVASDNSIAGSTTSHVRNESANSLDASGNWWGTDDEATVAAKMIAVPGTIDFTPYLDNGNDVPNDPSDGFQGDFSTLNVTAMGAQTSATGRIQEGIDLVTASTVNVMAGTYVETVNVNTTATVLGAQSAVDACGRVASESIIIPPGDTPAVVQITAANVTFSGFTIDGNGPAGSNEPLLTVGTSDAERGIAIDADNATVSNNRVLNIYRRGIQSWYAAGSAPLGGSIHQNEIEVIGAADTAGGANEGIAILSFSNPSATDNCIDVAHNGIYYIQVYAPSTAAIAITGNNVTAQNLGIGLNEMSSGIAATTLSGNTVATGNGAVGLLLWSVGNTILTPLPINTFTGDGTGWGVYGWVGTPGVPMNVSLSNTSISQYAIGVLLSNLENTFGPSQAAGAITLNGVSITSTSALAVGVRSNDEEVPGSSSVSITVTGNSTVTTNVTDGTGVFVVGPLASASVTGNTDTIVNNHYGVRLIRGGTATVGGNDFDHATTDNHTDIWLEPDAGTLTLGGTANNFGGDCYYIDNRSAQSVDLVASPQTYDVSGADVNFRIEDHMYHKVDAAASGLITWVAATRYVTTPGTGCNDETIQGGIDAANNNDTVHLESGNHIGGADASAEAITLNAGASPGQVTVNGNFTLSSDDTLPIEITGTNPATDYDNFIVNGDVTLGNAVLTVTATPTPVSGNMYTIIQNNGFNLVNGTFAGLPEGALIPINANLSYRISYQSNVGGNDGNDVTLTVHSGPATLELAFTSTGPYIPGQTVTATLSMKDLGAPAAGFQAFMGFDTAVLEYVSATFTSSPFGCPLLGPPTALAANSSGQIDLAAGVVSGSPCPGAPQMPSGADALLATITFEIKPGPHACSEGGLFFFRDPGSTPDPSHPSLNPPPTPTPTPPSTPSRVSDANAVEMLPLMLINAGSINISHSALVTVELEGVSAASITRCITFQFWQGPIASPPVDVLMTFTAGTGTTTIPLDCTGGGSGTDYTCVTATDKLHTLRRTIQIPTPDADNTYVIDFTAVNNKHLLGGNLNNDAYIDIIDFGVYVWQFNSNYVTGDTDCNTAYPHADISGNSTVFGDDYTYIQAHFLQFRDPNCDGSAVMAGGPGHDGPVVSLPMRELKRRGLEHLSIADLNNDKVIDQLDVAAYAQGAIPQLPADGGTGVISPESTPSKGR